MRMCVPARALFCVCVHDCGRVCACVRARVVADARVCVPDCNLRPCLTRPLLPRDADNSWYFATCRWNSFVASTYGEMGLDGWQGSWWMPRRGLRCFVLFPPVAKHDVFSSRHNLLFAQSPTNKQWTS